MYYVTMYEKYPIYEPAEGGYYYEGREMKWSYTCQEYRKAKRILRKLFKYCKKEGYTECKYWFQRDDHSKFGENGQYIGDGWYITLERKQGKDVRGWKPYC